MSTRAQPVSEGAPSAGSNFFVAFRVLSPERRRAIVEVYRFCRQADDAVDHAEDAVAARAALERASRRLEAAFSPEPSTGADGLREAIRRFDLPRQPFDDLIEGVSWDIDGRRFADTDALREYCYRVASTVGLLCVRIFGCSGTGCDRYARELGVALQWTNILRDIGVDIQRARVYLPQRSLERHGLSERDLSSPGPGAREKLSALVREEASYARSCFAAARAALPAEERPRVLSAEIMGGVYSELLRRVERAGYRVLERRISVPAWRRGWIAASLLLRQRLRDLVRSGA